MSDGSPHFLEHVGEYFIGGALSVIGWLMATFTKRHVESMDKLSERIDHIGTDVTEMKGDIRALKEHNIRTDHRLENLEDKR